MLIIFLILLTNVNAFVRINNNVFIDENNRHQYTEVKNIKWVNEEEALEINYQNKNFLNMNKPNQHLLNLLYLLNQEVLFQTI